MRKCVTYGGTDGIFYPTTSLFLACADDCSLLSNVPTWEEGCNIFLFKLHICGCGVKSFFIQDRAVSMRTHTGGDCGGSYNPDV